MGRRNARGLELSFKPQRGGRGRGRWFKKVGGREHYFGWGDGYTDRTGYQAALAAYRAWLEAGEEARRRREATAITRRLQHEFSPLGAGDPRPRLPLARERIERLWVLGLAPQSAETFTVTADAVEKRRLIETLRERPLDELRRALGIDLVGLAAAADSPKRRTTGELLDEFVAAQRQRMERRAKLDALRAAGQAVVEPAKQNISPGRFAAILRDVAAMKASVGRESWDGTEATAARIVRVFREESDALVLDGTHSPHTFNERVKLLRMFCAWAEGTYRLDRLPRDRALFAKYSTRESTAKAIPLDALRSIWDASDDRGRCWLLLGLNCAYYAKDVSDLTADMIDGTHLRHRREKTGVRVRYKLWKKTREYLRKFLPAGGGSGNGGRIRMFETTKGTPLVHHAKLKRSGEPVRVDNVRNWFFRLCKDLAIEGLSFTNVRDTASTEIEKIDRSMTDLFLAHSDKRMAALYLDGEMVDTGPLDRVIDELERRLDVWSKKRAPKPRAHA